MLAIVRVHMDYVKAFGVEPETRDEDDWTAEDEAEIADIIRGIQAEADKKAEEASGEDHSEEGEGTLHALGVRA